MVRVLAVLFTFHFSLLTSFAQGIPFFQNFLPEDYQANSINFDIDQLIGLSKIGIRLTETGAMRPHASVSGLMLAHPAARYFDLGRIDETQLADYARRRGMPAALMRRFLAERLDNK